MQAMSHCSCSHSGVGCCERWMKAAHDPGPLRSPPSMTLLLLRGRWCRGSLTLLGLCVLSGTIGEQVTWKRLELKLDLHLYFSIVLISFLCSLCFLSVNSAAIQLPWTLRIEKNLVLIEGNGSFHFFVHIFSFFLYKLPIWYVQFMFLWTLVEFYYFFSLYY